MRLSAPRYSWPRIYNGKPDYFSESTDAFLAFTLGKGNVLYINREPYCDTTLSIRLWCERVINVGRSFRARMAYGSPLPDVPKRLAVQGTCRLPEWRQRWYFQQIFQIQVMRPEDIVNLVEFERRLGHCEAYLKAVERSAQSVQATVG